MTEDNWEDSTLLWNSHLIIDAVYIICMNWIYRNIAVKLCNSSYNIICVVKTEIVTMYGSISQLQYISRLTCILNAGNIHKTNDLTAHLKSNQLNISLEFIWIYFIVLILLIAHKPSVANVWA